MADGKDLGALLGAAVAEEIVECRVDVSQWLGTDPETGAPVEFVYREPDLAALFIAHEDAAKIRMKAVEWSERMCQSVAYMIHAHQAPAVKVGDSKGLLYIAMAQQRPHLFRHLWERVMETFASAGNIEEAAQAREGECEAQPEV
jgi:hypothetical protein